ncbi:hypothetical protein [Alcanivorax nanhaiticus]|uniref:hypothetical protein n=1 Tax=Alcanivorax nanhaiticus TaxID=1177154 RepID=UPI000556CCF4|nr:hypothetical protein [Alcanivorax nanhaiticus]
MPALSEHTSKAAREVAIANIRWRHERVASIMARLPAISLLPALLLDWLTGHRTASSPTLTASTNIRHVFFSGPFPTDNVIRLLQEAVRIHWFVCGTNNPAHQCQCDAVGMGQNVHIKNMALLSPLGL